MNYWTPAYAGVTKNNNVRASCKMTVIPECFCRGSSFFTELQEWIPARIMRE